MKLNKQMKFSKDILELRHKYEKLIKLQQYERAEAIESKKFIFKNKPYIFNTKS